MTPEQIAAIVATAVQAALAEQDSPVKAATAKPKRSSGGRKQAGPKAASARVKAAPKAFEPKEEWRGQPMTPRQFWAVRNTCGGKVSAKLANMDKYEAACFIRDARAKG
jgi:hypothetical protein